MVFSYDELPYRASAYRMSHPNRMAALGTLFGMHPAPLPTCRYLEIGCATGGNMLPIACVMPDARFVGIDLGKDHIETARKEQKELGLANVEFHHMDVREITPELGEFDYIVTHGVYSWVPPDARDAILRVCRENLSEQGIAYISYNVYPGWFMLGMVREMMRRHTRPFETVTEKVGQARALLDFLAKTTRAGTVYGSFLRKLASDYKSYPDTYLYHEHLLANNVPFWFQEFVDQVEAAGLQYLGDGHFGSMLTSSFPPDVAIELDGLGGDLIVTEQYMDLINRRTFRTSLVCRADVKLKRTIEPDVLEGLMITSDLSPAGSAVDLSQGVEETFTKGPPDETVLSTASPFAKAALIELAERRPAALTFRELLEAARTRLAAAEIEAEGADEEQIAADLVVGFARGAIEFYVSADHFAGGISDRPRIVPTARRAAERGEQQVTDLRHFNVQLDVLDLSVARRLDGGHDRAALLAGIQEDFEAGVLRLGDDHADAAKDPEKLLWILEGAVEERLAKFLRYWLLVR